VVSQGKWTLYLALFILTSNLKTSALTRRYTYTPALRP